MYSAFLHRSNFFFKLIWGGARQIFKKGGTARAEVLNSQRTPRGDLAEGKEIRLCQPSSCSLWESALLCSMPLEFFCGCLVFFVLLCFFHKKMHPVYSSILTRRSVVTGLVNP